MFTAKISAVCQQPVNPSVPVRMTLKPAMLTAARFHMPGYLCWDFESIGFPLLRFSSRPF